MANSIRELLIQIKAKISGFLDSETAADVAIILVILLVGAGSFGLGRLSIEEKKGEVVLRQAETTANPEPMPIGGQLVASRYGSKYYYPWCGGAKTIKDSNLIWFDNEEKARASGYTPAANCKGL